jgi:hypothetical protein
MREVVATTIDVTRTIDNNPEPVEVFLDGWVDFTVDKNYGADADGNRGMKKIIVNDVFDVSATDDQGNDVILTEEEKAVAEEALVRQFLEG